MGVRLFCCFGLDFAFTEFWCISLLIVFVLVVLLLSGGVTCFYSFVWYGVRGSRLGGFVVYL